MADEERQRDADRENYVHEHILIFGHVPLLDLTGRHQCTHVMHSVLEQVISAPGVDVEIPFESREVETEDDPGVIELGRRYDARVEQFKDKIADLDEREAFIARPVRKRLY